MTSKKVLLVGGFDRSLLNFRGDLIRDIVAAGHTVAAAAPPEHAEVPAALAANGARFCPIELNRTSLNPFGELRANRSVAAVLRRERPDVILAYTIKPVLHAMTANRTGTGARFALITGLGSAFHSPGAKGWILSQLATILYRRALRRCTAVFVQNRDIATFFSKKRIVRDAARLVVVPGSGVDLGYYGVQPFAAGPPCFLFVGRLLRDKGVVEFVEAARQVRARIPAARFLMVGDLDSNPTTITKADIEAWRGEGVVEHRSFLSDVRPALRECGVLVLPSYHEGMPRAVLEAMASGRPVITTDTIGCRDTVFDIEASRAGDPFLTGSNGLLVPVRSVKALSAAMQWLAEQPGVRAAMGKRSRDLAAKHFDVRMVNARMLQVMLLSSPIDS